MAVIVALSALLGAVLPRLFPFVGAIENRIADLRLATLSAPEPPHPDIIVVTVTEDTLATLPYRSPLDRRFLAGVLRTLEDGGVRAIGLDILFDQPTDPENDGELRAVLRNMKIPVVAAWADSGDQLTERQAGFLGAYLEGIAKGRVNLYFSPSDGVVRRIFSYHFQSGGRIKDFASTLAEALGADVPFRSVRRLAYRPGAEGGSPPFKSFPAHTVKFLPKPWLAGKIVLIGSDLPHSDRFRTPMEDGTVSGIFIFAHALAQLLDGRRPPGLGLGAEAGLAAALALFGLILAGTGIPVPAKAAAFAVVLAVLWIGGFALFMTAGWMLPLISPSLAFAVSSGVASAYLGHEERRQKRFIRQAFSRYISPAVVDDLVNHPSRLELGGERRELTYIFTDIAGFTSLIEKSEPSEILPLLNAYLDGMCAIAFRHGGTIDKIVGDAVVIFFGAPADQPDHPARAVRCALDLDAFARSFAAERKAEGVDFGKTRIGVNTGPATVGNFGGENFFDYTAHGDMVNTAARLESVNKHLGTNVCISGLTASRCKDVNFRPIGELVLKGKTQGVETFEPLSEDEASSPAMAAYHAAYHLLRQGDPGARSAFERLAAENPDDPLAALHAGRLAAGESGVTIVLKDK